MELKFITLIFMISTFLLSCKSSEFATFDLPEENFTIGHEQEFNKADEEEIVFVTGGYGNKYDNSRLYTSCSEVTKLLLPSGVYELRDRSKYYTNFKVACDTKTWGGCWTIILHRMDGSVNFYRNWQTYEDGFGDLDGEFFLGLEKIYELTKDGSQQLLVLLEDSKGNESYETYEKFAISSSSEDYALNTLGKASGPAGDSLSIHHTQKFSTYDRKNNVGDANCAQLYTGAWWYAGCHHSNLAGKYGDNTHGKGINWLTFRGQNNSLKRAVMMIRPRK